MAEEKKPTKAILGDGDNKKAFEQIIFLLVGIALLGAIVIVLRNYIESLGLGTANSLWEKILDYFLQHIWPIWKLIAAIVSALALAGIIHNARKLRAINIEENKIYNPPPSNSVSDGNRVVELKNGKWEKVMKYTSSNNASDWRLAIIEADVMLEGLLHTLGYVGESIGDMLKSVDKNEFLTIEDAWEAHKIRNAIAHSGGDFQLNERETKRVIALFEKVFKEFQVI
ncbi:MAG: hypothetical protein Q7R89_01730 [bacterium]|nr:hypothetical protein [bacterium]